MKSKVRLLIAVVAFVGYAILDATPASGEDRWYNVKGGSPSVWSSAVNWCTGCTMGATCNLSVPDATQTVRICANEVVTVNVDAVAKSVYLESGSTRIDIDPTSADRSLTLGSGDTALTSTLQSSGCEIRLLAGTAPKEATLTIAAVDHTFSGAGKIVGQDNDAELSIPTLRKVTISTAGIEGHLKINGEGSFLNQGYVDANSSTASSVMYFDVRTLLNDNAGADKWMVSQANSTLQFAETIGNFGPMAGEFYLTTGAGVCKLDHALTTTGTLDIRAGTLQVNSGTTQFGDLDFAGGAIEVADGVSCEFD